MHDGEKGPPLITKCGVCQRVQQERSPKWVCLLLGDPPKSWFSFWFPFKGAKAWVQFTFPIAPSQTRAHVRRSSPRTRLSTGSMASAARSGASCWRRPKRCWCRCRKSTGQRRPTSSAPRTLGLRWMGKKIRKRSGTRAKEDAEAR